MYVVRNSLYVIYRMYESKILFLDKLPMCENPEIIQLAIDIKIKKLKKTYAPDKVLFNRLKTVSEF